MQQLRVERLEKNPTVGASSLGTTTTMKPVLQLKALSRDERGIGTEGGQVKKKKKIKNQAPLFTS